MRRKDLVTTTMALTLAVFMSAVSTGCGNDTSEVALTDGTDAVVSTELSTQISEDRYEIVDVQIPYKAMVKEDINLIEDLETNTESSVSVAKETYVTVTAEVYCDGVLQDFYRVELEDGSKGFIEGRYLEFNFDVVEDYADRLVEVEEPENVESTEETSQEEAPVDNTVLYTIIDCDPLVRYANTKSNVRAIPDKSGELVDVIDLNTEVTVTGKTEDGVWSRTERNGLVCYIKSSLLSDTKTKVQTSTNSNSGGGNSSTASQSSGGTQSQPQASQPAQTQPAPQPAPQPSQPDTSGLPADFFADETTGTGGYWGGTTGSTTEGNNWGTVE